MIPTNGSSFGRAGGRLRRYPGGTENASIFATVRGSIPNRRAASRRLSPSTYTARRTCPYSSTPFIPPPSTLQAEGYLVLEFYSGATGLSGRFTEGFSLRRLHSVEFPPQVIRTGHWSRPQDVFAVLLESSQRRHAGLSALGKTRQKHWATGHPFDSARSFDHICHSPSFVVRDQIRVWN